MFSYAFSGYLSVTGTLKDEWHGHGCRTDPVRKVTTSRVWTVTVLTEKNFTPTTQTLVVLTLPFVPERYRYKVSFLVSDPKPVTNQTVTNNTKTVNEKGNPKSQG